MNAANVDVNGHPIFCHGLRSKSFFLTSVDDDILCAER